MHDITIYFMGGKSVVLEEVNEETTDLLVEWLDGDTKETFKVNIPFTNKTKCIRKEMILFIDVV